MNMKLPPLALVGEARPAVQPIEDEGEATLTVSLTDDSPSYALLKAVVMSNDQPLTRRIRCAIAALPYEAPKLAVSSGSGGAGTSQLSLRQPASAVAGLW